jgi:hypothetical protein
MSRRQVSGYAAWQVKCATTRLGGDPQYRMPPWSRRLWRDHFYGLNAFDNRRRRRFDLSHPYDYSRMVGNPETNVPLRDRKRMKPHLRARITLWLPEGGWQPAAGDILEFQME